MSISQFPSAFVTMGGAGDSTAYSFICVNGCQSADESCARSSSSVMDVSKKIVLNLKAKTKRAMARPLL